VVNDAAVGRYGYSRQQFLTMTMADIQLPSPGGTQAIGPRPAGAAGPWVGTQQHRAEDGSIVHVEIAVTQVLRAGQRLDLVLAHDIGEGVIAEEALQASATFTASSSTMQPEALTGSAPLRTVLYHDGCRQGHGAGPLDRLRDRQAERRLYLRQQ
jgi:hypothetical protein